MFRSALPSARENRKRRVMVMTDELFVLSLGLLLASLVHWAVKRLPDERWQFLASVPVMKDASGHWHGSNFTYYGLLTANALVFGVALLIVLFGALRISMGVALSVILTVLAVCLPASKWIARLVEGKRCTFTIAGAFFVGIFTAPAVIHGVNAFLPSLGARPIPIMPALAAVLIAYSFGEGLGRLACISFGCCYGALLSESHPLLQRLFNQWHFIFSGKMKKISYASAMDGKQVIPVQAVTAVIYLCTGLVSLLLFLYGKFTPAFVLAMAVTQGWRVLSETLRADIAAKENHRRIRSWPCLPFCWLQSWAFSPAPSCCRSPSCWRVWRSFGIP